MLRVVGDEATRCPPLSFVPLREVEDPLAVMRDRDHLRWLRGETPSQDRWAAIGLSMFVGTTFATAHAPGPLRWLFDGPVHVGPALFQGGGMGASVAGTLP